MRNAIELAVVLLLMAIGHGMVNTAPNVVRRVVTSVVLWWFVFAAGIAVLYFPDLAAWGVRVAVVALAFYFGRWGIAWVLGAVSGPRLFDVPDTVRLASAAHEVSGLPMRECRRFSRRMCRRYDGDIALLGLLALSENEADVPPDFEVAWDDACGRALETVRESAMRLAGKWGGSRLKAADAAFLAQASCLYERRSLERLVFSVKAKPLGSRAARFRSARRLADEGKPRAAAEGLNLAAAGHEKDETESAAKDMLDVKTLLCPPLAFAQLGFGWRAMALGISEATLLLYALFGLITLYPLGWGFLWNTSWGVFLGVAMLIHVEALFALGDFRRLARHVKGHSGSEGQET